MGVLGNGLGSIVCEVDMASNQETGLLLLDHGAERGLGLLV